jgi:hypothetical protein
MALLARYTAAVCKAILVLIFVGLTGCSKTIRIIENNAFKVIVNRLNPSAFDAYVLSVYVEPIGGPHAHKTRLLEIQGPDDICGSFISHNLLLLRDGAIMDFSSYRIHYILRLPMDCVGPITYDMSSSNDPFLSDTIPYATDAKGSRIVYFDSTRIDKAVIIRTADTSQFLYTRAVLLRPVERIEGYLINEDTLSLSVIWCGENKSQEILIKLPASKAEDLEYVVRE